jgi:hypothetical protein
MLLSSNQYHALLGSAEPPPQNGSASKGIAGCSIELRTDTECLDFNDYLHHAYFSVKKHWSAEMPGSLAKGQQGSNAIEFHILQNGSVPKDSVKVGKSRFFHRPSRHSQGSGTARGAGPLARLCAAPLVRASREHR